MAKGGRWGLASCPVLLPLISWERMRSGRRAWEGNKAALCNKANRRLWFPCRKLRSLLLPRANGVPSPQQRSLGGIRVQVVVKTPRRHIHAQKKTCTRMFRAALLKIARRWKQPKYASMAEWINRKQSGWAAQVAQWFSAACSPGPDLGDPD